MNQPQLVKPRLSKHSLKACGIIFDAQIYEPPEGLSSGAELPEHVEDIRKTLLNFKATVHPEWKEDNIFIPEIALKPVESAWLDITGRHAITLAEKNREKAARSATETSIQISRELRDLPNNAEDAWIDIIIKKIFRPFRHTEMEIENDQMQEWRSAQNLPWNEFERWKKVNPQRHGLTGPKPDITYGYPIYRPGEQLPNVLKLHNWAKPFSYTFLRALREQPGINLRSSPNTRLATAKSQKDLREENLLCFPWAVVEFEHATAREADVEFCYCQAANASAMALDMRQSLYEEAHAKGLQLEVPPIVSFTCIGPKLKLWLTYIKNVEQVELKMMKCIYDTDLLSPWGVLSTREIVKNMREWAVLSERSTTGLLLTLLDYGRLEPKHEEPGIHGHSSTQGSPSNVVYRKYRQPILDIPTDYESEPSSPKTPSHGPASQANRPPARRSRRLRHYDTESSTSGRETIESDDESGHVDIQQTVLRTLWARPRFHKQNAAWPVLTHPEGPPSTDDMSVETQSDPGGVNITEEDRQSNKS